MSQAIRRCKICGNLKPVGFTDFGLICEPCFQIECAKLSFNAGVEASAKEIDFRYPELAKEIRTLKKVIAERKESI